MKNKIYVLMVVGILLSGCDDFFEIDRPPQTPWNTVDEFERAPVGAYAGLFSGHEWNMAWVNERIVKSSLGDDVGFVSNPEWGYKRNSKEYNVYTERNFVQLYRVIATVNNALEFVDETNGDPFPSASLSDKENNVKRIVGELHFVRAYAYYILITTFGHAYVPGGDNSTPEIPIPTTYAHSAEEARNPVIGSTEQVYQLIISDLQIARDMLPAKFDPALHHPSYSVRANRYAAAAMLVRAYMQTGQYAEALEECNFIIDQNNGEYDMTEDPIQAFNKSSVSRGREVIFYTPFFDDNLPPPSHISVINNTWSGKPTPWVETYMGFKTVQRLGWMDNPQSDTSINIEALRDKRFAQLHAVRYPESQHKPNQAFETRASIKDFTTIWCNKYYRGPKGDRTNVPLIRLAEIHLTRAWIRFNSGNVNGAADDLNVVRARAWNAAVAGSAYTPLTGGTITESIINDERLIELWNEGDRIDYFRAIKKDIPDGERGSSTLPYTSESFVWSVPALELNFNDAL